MGSEDGNKTYGHLATERYVWEQFGIFDLEFFD